MKRSRLSILTLALAACSGNGPLRVPPPSDGGADAAPKTYTFRPAVPGDIDMLVVVDNSLSMKPLQTKLATAFPVLLDVWRTLPGGMPNLHLAVVNADMGAGPYGEIEIPACRKGGDGGAFQSTMRLAQFCAKGSLDPNQTFIISSDAGKTKNFTGNLADAFACIAGLGDTGCGFEHQLASVLRALGADGQPPPPTNANFLRPDAYLSVVILSDEDDCSAPPDSTLFNPASRFVSDAQGPLASYRCNEFGHLCGGQKPPRMAPSTPRDLGTCTSAEDGTLLKVADVIAKLKALKADPAKVFVATIAGPPTPYIVEGGPATLKTDPVQSWAQVRHSCTAPDGTYADPGVRLNMLIDGFGSNGRSEVICNESLGPVLRDIAGQVGGVIPSARHCLDTGSTPSQCTFVDHTVTPAGMRVDTPIPSCLDNGNKTPCWSASSGSECGTGVPIQFNRAPDSISADMYTTATCAP